MTAPVAESPPAAGETEQVEPTRPARARDHVPGLAVAILATLAAAYLSERYGAPLTLMALLVGLAFNFLNADKRLTPGLAFASRPLLQIGIVLLGARITLGQIAGLGPGALAAIMVVIAAAMLFALLVAHRLGFGSPFGALAGGAVAICGASAAIALYAVLGEKRVNQAQLALVLVGISAISSLAMILYPILAHLAGFSDRQAGFLIGASIHDVAQVMGAGYAFSAQAGDTAAIVKLVRVAMLAPLLLIVAGLAQREPGMRLKGIGVPWFVAGFFVVATLNSVATLPAVVDDAAETGAAALLACAVTATGIRAPMAKLLDTGWRPFMVIFAASAAALAVAGLFAALFM